MKIKKLVVDSLQEAVEEVRNLYGPDATILSTRIIKKRLDTLFTLYLPFSIGGYHRHPRHRRLF
jgi:flagellar biosynthesis GTPase FlhF